MSSRRSYANLDDRLHTWALQLVGGDIVQQLQRWVRMSGGRQYNADGAGVYRWPIQRERLVDMRELCRRVCMSRRLGTVDMSLRSLQ